MRTVGSRYRVRPGSGAVGMLDGVYDLFLCALGFEERSSYVAESVPCDVRRRLALMFDDDSIEGLPQQGALAGLGFDVVRLADDAVGGEIASALEAATAASSNRLRVALDISSFSRVRLFDILSALIAQSRTSAIDLDLLYAPARVDPALAQEQVTIESVGLLAPELSGWGSDPSLPLAAVVGVGAERDLALGVAEYLEVSKIHAFVPTGIDPAFDAIAVTANAEFFVADYVTVQNVYDLLQPDVLLTRLEALLYGLARESRVAIVPLGPKLFSVCAILSAFFADAPIAVWRFSQGLSAAHRPAIASGVVIRLPLSLEPFPAEEPAKA